MEHYTIVLLMCMVAMGSAQSVINFGAVGDGIRDDSGAFLKAWNTICKGATRNPRLVVPAGRTFLLHPVSFQGPCRSSIITFQIDGNIVAPTNLGAFGNQRERWISFININGLRVEAKGLLDGKGPVWWAACPILGPNCRRPTLLSFFHCTSLTVNGLRTLNSGRNHISVAGVHGAAFTNLHLSAPKTSTNTDGIDIAGSSNVRIENSYIGTGDDCIAVNTGSSAININRVNCGPGHGISVGSLGKNGQFATVYGVFVSNCNLTGTQNGVRIKTFPGGNGYAKNIWFTNINLFNSDNPIIIDQSYFAAAVRTKKSTGVHVSDVHFIGIQGTSIRKAAINLRCSKTVGCHGIELKDINIMPSGSIIRAGGLTAICTNAHGNAIRTSPAVTCLLP